MNSVINPLKEISRDRDSNQLIPCQAVNTTDNTTGALSVKLKNL